jgi:hypothetical protein
MEYAIVEINSLRPHESIDGRNFARVLSELSGEGMLHMPVLVDRDTRVILDGHHRCGALKKLGASRVPALLLDYFSDGIEVMPRRKGSPVDKKAVIEAAMSGKIFPPKTTKHLVAEEVAPCNVRLESLF